MSEIVLNWSLVTKPMPRMHNFKSSRVLYHLSSSVSVDEIPFSVVAKDTPPTTLIKFLDMHMYCAGRQVSTSFYRHKPCHSTTDSPRSKDLTFSLVNFSSELSFHVVIITNRRPPRAGFYRSASRRKRAMRYCSLSCAFPSTSSDSSRDWGSSARLS